MMRIAQVNLNDSGGAFALMYQVQKELSGRVIFDYYTIHAFSNQRIVKNIQEMGGKIVEDSANTRLISHLRLPFVFYNRMKKEQYEVIHIHSDSAWKLSMYAIPAKLAGIKKIIVHSHSSGINGDHRKLKYFCHCFMKSILPHFADEFISCSQTATEWMFPEKYKSRVRFIKNGIKTLDFCFNEESRQKYRNELGVKDSEILIGTIGDLSFQKNPHYLIEVFSEVYRRNHKFKLVFIGDGEHAFSVMEWAREKRGYENIIFYGKSLHVEDLLSAIDIYIMPSRFEGFPVSAIEAQANGLTCILSDYITHEVKISEKCFFWSTDEKPDKWAERIYKLDGYFKERKKGYLVALQKGFDISQTAEQILQLYSNDPYG